MIALRSNWIGKKLYYKGQEFLDGLSFDHDHAERGGLNVRLWDFLFYALFGLIVTSFVQVGGVLMVFSYLIVPAASAVFLVKSLPLQLLVGWLVATLGSVAGLYWSFQKDLPTGAAIVCALGVALLMAGVVSKLRRA
jgi:zinc/manganese transport system permease protein